MKLLPEGFNRASYRQNHSELGRRLRNLIDECRGLATHHQIELQQLTANAEALARLRHLRLHQIADADIPKIGAGRKQILASYNIVTAADVEWDIVRVIKGFGDVYTGNLVAWKEGVLGTFRFDPATAVSTSEQQTLAVRFRARQQQILGELDRGLTEIESLEPRCRASLQLLAPDLKEAIAAWEQAKADLDLIRYGGR